MATRFFRQCAVAVSCVALLLGGAGAFAQGQVVQQVLDRMAVFNGGTALQMRFDDPGARPPDFYNFDLDATVGLRSCQVNGTRGLYCLDGRDVRRWADPEAGGPGEVEFSCANDALLLDKKRADTCSAIAVAQNGEVWISGRRGSAYVLIRLHEKDEDGNCRAYGNSLWPVATSRYCFKEYASGRPLLLKLVVVEGEEAARFDRGTGVPEAGVLGLDVRNAVTFFPSELTAPLYRPAAPVDLAVGKTVWGLGSRELLADLALLQQANPSAPGDLTDNFVLAVTSTGRVLARQTDLGGTTLTIQAFDVPFERVQPGAPAPVQCDATAPRYGIAASTKSGRVYVSDRNYCQVLALRAAGPPFGGLVNVEDEPGEDLTLSTSYDNPLDPEDPEHPLAETGTYPPDGATVAPGIVVNLVDCRGSCTLIANTNEQPIAQLLNVALNSDASRMVLFQAPNVPDCRYRLYANPNDPVCAGFRDAVITPPGKPAVPEEQFLDVARMLPSDITDQFPATDTLPPGLPPLLVSPQYRGRADRNYVFGVLIGITEPGVVFRDVFDAVFEVDQLIGSAPESRCVRGYGPQTPLATLLQWDVVTWSSESYIAPGGPYGLAPTYLDPETSTVQPNKYRYVDTIVNSGCGSTQTRIVSKSMIAYGMETTYAGRDDVYALLVAKLFQDLKAAQTELTCQAGVDSPASDPLRSDAPDSVCPTLLASLLNAEDKLTKCIGATRQPKVSAVDQNCQSFEVQFAAYREELDEIAAAPPELDPANRIGGLKARGETLWHVYTERFLPSVPPGGFQSPTPGAP